MTRFRAIAPLNRCIAAMILGVGVGLGFGLQAGARVAMAEPLRIITSNTILADLAQQIGGERVTVSSLVGAGGDPHEFQPSPRDAARISAADLVIVNGLGLDRGIEQIARSALRPWQIIVAGDSLDLRPIAGDPHLWQDPLRVVKLVEALAGWLMARDPNSIVLYDRRLTDYLQQLQTLDRELRASFRTIAPQNRKIITSHDAFGYFAAAYGIEFMAPAGTASQTEPSAQRLRRLIAQIRENHIRIIFVETISDPRIMAQIAAETGARIGLPLYSDSLSPAGGVADSYLAMIRYNARQFLAAMRASQ
ncbi:MAG: zinc ABC transporter substrate-binding protein [Alphaproteobacteria bacterium]|nr:zinc ABC transporter substrate-binding protein [Alphaproteobacteria bacterium]